MDWLTRNCLTAICGILSPSIVKDTLPDSPGNLVPFILRKINLPISWLLYENRFSSSSGFPGDRQTIRFNKSEGGMWVRGASQHLQFVVMWKGGGGGGRGGGEEEDKPVVSLV